MSHDHIDNKAKCEHAIEYAEQTDDLEGSLEDARSPRHRVTSLHQRQRRFRTLQNYTIQGLVLIVDSVDTMTSRMASRVCLIPPPHCARQHMARKPDLREMRCRCGGAARVAEAKAAGVRPQ